jgi:hypothetical protein
MLKMKIHYFMCRGGVVNDAIAGVCNNFIRLWAFAMVEKPNSIHLQEDHGLFVLEALFFNACIIYKY